MRFGVLEEELPIVKIPKIGRETARNIRKHCQGVLRVSYSYSGTPEEMLLRLLDEKGEKEFLKHMEQIPNIAGVRAETILKHFKAKLSKK